MLSHGGIICYFKPFRHFIFSHVTFNKFVENLRKINLSNLAKISKFIIFQYIIRNKVRKISTLMEELM